VTSKAVIAWLHTNSPRARLPSFLSSSRRNPTPHSYGKSTNKLQTRFSTPSRAFWACRRSGAKFLCGAEKFLHFDGSPVKIGPAVRALQRFEKFANKFDFVSHQGVPWAVTSHTPVLNGVSTFSRGGGCNRSHTLPVTLSALTLISTSPSLSFRIPFASACLGAASAFPSRALAASQPFLRVPQSLSHRPSTRMAPQTPLRRKA
jgi:hypothetical protein